LVSPLGQATLLLRSFRYTQTHTHTRTHTHTHTTCAGGSGLGGDKEDAAMALNSSSSFGGSFGGYAVCTFNFGEKPVEPLGGFLSNQNVERMQVRRSVICRDVCRSDALSSVQRMQVICSGIRRTDAGKTLCRLSRRMQVICSVVCPTYAGNMPWHPSNVCR
jgi:hypothetical protein